MLGSEELIVYLQGNTCIDANRFITSRFLDAWCPEKFLFFTCIFFFLFASFKITSVISNASLSFDSFPLNTCIFQSPLSLWNTRFTSKDSLLESSI